MPHRHRSQDRVAHERRHHEEVAVGEINQPQDSVDHAVADRHQCEKRTNKQTVCYFIKKKFHGTRL